MPCCERKREEADSAHTKCVMKISSAGVTFASSCKGSAGKWSREISSTLSKP